MPGGGQFNDVISVMDVFPTLAQAAGVASQAEKPMDGQNRWPALSSGRGVVRQGPLFFGSNSPIYNRFHVGVIDGDWKLVQIIDHKNAETTVENFLFHLSEDLNEQNNLAEKHPDRVKTLAKKINDWRSQHPINGVTCRSHAASRVACAKRLCGCCRSGG